MTGLIVASPTGAGTPARAIEVRLHQSITFGRGSPEAPVDVTLADQGAEPVAGVIRAAGDFWTITNLSRVRSYVVENEEGGGEYLRVPPGRLAMPVPFRRARVTLASAQGLLSLTVTAPRPAYLYPPPPQADTGRMGAAFSLNESAKYFLVLVALCEPRLCDASSMVIPGTADIVRRLRRLDSCRSLTSSAVNFHITYLAGKLRVKEQDGHAPGSRANWQREAMVSRALRFGLVRDEHLALLS